MWEAQHWCMQVAVPKAVLQQHCHKCDPPLRNPRFNKTSRQGEPFRYSCTITFPPPRFKKKTAAANGAPVGPQTWQLLESEDGWRVIQDAQNAVALKALFDLVPSLTDTQRLVSPHKYGPQCLACCKPTMHRASAWMVARFVHHIWWQALCVHQICQ